MVGETGIVFNGLVWEIRDWELSRLDISFNESQQRLIRAGWERHPTSAEIFSFIFADHDSFSGKGPLISEEQGLVLDSISNRLFYTHLSQAIEIRWHGRVRTVLFYEAVTAMQMAPKIPTEEGDDLFWVGCDKSSMQYAGVREFDIRDLKWDFGRVCLFRRIFRRHDNMIKYLTSRFFKELPEEMQESGGICLPGSGDVLPLGMDDRHIFCYEPNASLSSQGVRNAQNTYDKRENSKNLTLEHTF